MKKDPGQIKVEREIKKALNNNDYKALVKATTKMYDFLGEKEKLHAKAYTAKGKHVAKNYGKQLADSILSKESRKQKYGKEALAKAETEEEEKEIRAKMKITSKDISHLKDNIEIVKRSSVRSKEVMLKAMYKEDVYSKMMKDFYGKGNKVASLKFADEIVKYVGGDRQEGYVYRTRKNSRGRVFEIRTPGYDERNHRFHGFQYREIGEDGRGIGTWIGS